MLTYKPHVYRAPCWIPAWLRFVLWVRTRQCGWPAPPSGSCILPGPPPSWLPCAQWKQAHISLRTANRGATMWRAEWVQVKRIRSSEALWWVKVRTYSQYSTAHKEHHSRPTESWQTHRKVHTENPPTTSSSSNEHQPSHCSPPQRFSRASWSPAAAGFPRWETLLVLEAPSHRFSEMRRWCRRTGGPPELPVKEPDWRTEWKHQTFPWLQLQLSVSRNVWQETVDGLKIPKHLLPFSLRSGRSIFLLPQDRGRGDTLANHQVNWFSTF